MNFKSVVKIVISPFPGGSVVNQFLAEMESAQVDRRLEILENPLSDFGDDAKPLCHLLYKAVQDHADQFTNRVPWSDDLAPYLKTLRRFEACGMLEGSPVLGQTNEYLRGVRLSPRFLVYLGLIGGDAELCKKLSELLDWLASGKGVDGRKIRESIPLPLAVVDAFLTVYEREGQGLKSNEIGASYYIAK